MSRRGARLVVAVSLTLSSLAVVADVAPAGAAPVSAKVNFQPATAPVPSGYAVDEGGAYDATRGYGWIAQDSTTPVSIVGNARDRNAVSDQRLDTFIHMQLPANTSGVHTPARWEYGVPAGTYDVTVAVGDAAYFDSVHNLTVEGTVAIDHFTPSAATPFDTRTVRVTVNDGRLTLDAAGGTNTKLDYVDITQVTTTGPTVIGVDPSNGATGVPVTTSVVLNLSAPADFATIGPTTVRLLDAAGTQVDGNYNSDAAGALVSFTPLVRLASNATYTVQTTAGLTDTSGTAFAPFTSTFTTGASGIPPAPYAFDTVRIAALSAPTVAVIGPDGKLYVATAVGQILRYTLDTTGLPTGPPESLGPWAFQRTILGLAFDPASTASNLKLWVSHSFMGDQDVPDFQGKISVLTGPTLATARDVISGLPRSTRDHMTNGITFGPDGRLYIAQGSVTGYGAPDAYWGFRQESPLSAAILAADVDRDTRFASTVNVDTSAGYDPTVAGAPVTVYASGTRNPFDLVWHSSGGLYAPVNESASGDAPAGPGGNPPGLTNLPAGRDFLARIVAGKYYGHPNPSRGEYVLNGGNPTSNVDPWEQPQYPVGVQPDPDWQAPVYDFGLHRSADGITEYRASSFGGALKGKLLVTEFSNGDDVLALTIGSTGTVTNVEQLAAGFDNPLGIAADPASGNIYVTEYGAQADGSGGGITLLRPAAVTTTPVARVNFQPSTSPVPTGYTADDGSAYDAGRGYGWIAQDSSTPLSLVGNTRDRNATTDQRLDTFIHMQLPANVSGVHSPGRWEYAVPNGTYNVTVAAGDASYFDSVHNVTVEGTVAIDHFTPTAATPFQTQTARVDVTDGEITIDAAGGTNTKLDYVDIDRVTSGGVDTTTPSVSISLNGPTTDGSTFTGPVAVTVNATDTGSGVKTITYRLDGGTTQPYTGSFTVAAAGAHTVQVTATDNAGNVGTGSSTFTITSSTGGAAVANVNFQPTAAPVPAGYTVDDGSAFDATRGYGWIDESSSTPVSIVGNARDRNVNPDQRLDTLIHMQLPAGTAGVHTPARWELAVASGTYDVTVAVGDPSYFDSVHRITVEGTVAIDNFVPSAATPSQTRTVRVSVTDGRLTLDAAGGTNTKLDYVDVTRVATGTDTTPPTVGVSLAGSSAGSNTYTGPVTVTISASDAGSGVAGVSYRLDGGPSTTYTAPFTVSAPGSHTVQATAVDGAGNTGTATSTFAITSGSSSTMAVTSPDDILGNGSRLVFSTVNEETRPSRAVTIRNTGTGTLNVTNLTITGPQASLFALAAGQPKSFSIAPGSTANVAVVFVPPSQQLVENYATLTIASNDATTPSYAVALAGIDARDYEGGNEPGLYQLVHALGWTTNIGVTANFVGNTRLPVGEELISPYWKAADSAKPVQLVPVAHYSGRTTGSTLATGWHLKGSTTRTTLFSFPGGSDPSGGQNQRLLPGYTGTTSFSPGGVFGLWSQTPDWSDDQFNSGNHLHDFRFWPARDPSGNVIANAWVVGYDIGSDINYTGKNYDYQDGVFLLLNAAPELTTAPAPGTSPVTLDFSAARPGTIADRDGEGTGFTSVQANAAGTQYQPALIDLDTTAGVLRITSTSGVSSGSANAQQNALELGFDATRHDWRISARLVGPLDKFATQFQQQAIQFGPDKDNFLKLEVEDRGGKPNLTLYREEAGVGGLPVSPVVLPSPSTIRTLDLFFTGDVASGSVTGSFRINSDDPADIVGFGTAFQPKDVLRWFSTQARAVASVANESTTTSVVGVYDRFSVDLFTMPNRRITWSSGAAAPQQRHEAGGIAVAGKVYEFGGYVDTTYVPVNRADVYDPATNTWVSLPPMPEAASHMGVATDGRYVYLAGGYLANGSGGQTFATTHVWRFDTQTATWSAMPPLPDARGSGALVVLGQQLHFFGGSDASRADRVEHWVLDFTALSPSWATSTPLPSARNHMGYGVVNGRIYAVGGQKGQDASAVIQSRVDVWDPAFGAWLQVANLTPGRSHISSGTTVVGGKLYVLGGETAYNVTTSAVVVYDPQANNWRTYTSLPASRSSGIAAAVGSTLYYATGNFSTTTYRGVLG